MKRLAQFILIMISMAYLLQAQAMVNVDTGISECAVLAADDSKNGKDKKPGDKKGDQQEGEEEEEEEPDCE